MRANLANERIRADAAAAITGETCAQFKQKPRRV